MWSQEDGVFLQNNCNALNSVKTVWNISRYHMCSTVDCVHRARLLFSNWLPLSFFFPPGTRRSPTRVWCSLKIYNSKVLAAECSHAWFLCLTAGRTMTEGWPRSCPAPSPPLCRLVWDQGRSTPSTWWPSGTRGGANPSPPLSQHVGIGPIPKVKNLTSAVEKIISRLSFINGNVFTCVTN